MNTGPWVIKKMKRIYTRNSRDLLAHRPGLKPVSTLFHIIENFNF